MKERGQRRNGSAKSRRAGWMRGRSPEAGRERSVVRANCATAGPGVRPRGAVGFAAPPALCTRGGQKDGRRETGLTPRRLARIFADDIFRVPTRGGVIGK